MPSLISMVFTDPTNEPLIWQCSSCEAAFGPGDTQDLNKEFRAHCKDRHPGEKPIVGIETEDVNQAAARTIREATERD